MHDPFIAVRSATDLRSHALDLRRRWGTRFEDGRTTGVRQVIAASWTRMLGAGLDPERLRPSAAGNGDALARAREASPLRHCLPDLRGTLASLADDAEHIMVVADATGTLLWIEGHGRVLEQAEAIDFVPGMDWTEGSAGTNAIGTALAIDHAVQIFSAEHFLPEQHPWWCSAAPIHDPRTGALLGVVNLSGPQRTAHPHSLALVDAAAAIAELALRDDPRRNRSPGTAAKHEATTTDVSAPRPRVRINLLTAHRPTMTRPGEPPRELTMRQAEVLALLALHPHGLTAEQLTLLLYGDGGNTVTTRALVSRLRKVVGDTVATQPYRLRSGVQVDVSTLQHLLSGGDGFAAIAMYDSPLLASSQVVAIEQARIEIDLAVREAAIAHGHDTLWRWLGTTSGSDDLAAVELFLDVAPPGDVRRPMARARRQSLVRDWQR